MTELEAISAAALTLLVGAISPGPSLAVVVRATLQGGRRGGVACAIGHGLGFAFYALAVVFGLATMMAEYPTVFNAVQWAGVALLIFLAYKTLTRSTSSSHEAEPSARGHVATGFFTAFLNPKIALFFLAVFATVLQPNVPTHRQILIALIGWFIDTLWYAFVAIALSAPRNVAALQNSGRWIDRVMVVLLLSLALATSLRLVGS